MREVPLTRCQPYLPRRRREASSCRGRGGAGCRCTRRPRRRPPPGPRAGCETSRRLEPRRASCRLSAREWVLLRAAAVDEGLPDSLASEPLADRLGRELAPVVRAQDLGSALCLEELGQLLDDIASADRARDSGADAEPGVLVDDVEDPHR